MAARRLRDYYELALLSIAYDAGVEHEVTTPAEREAATSRRPEGLSTRSRDTAGGFAGGGDFGILCPFPQQPNRYAGALARAVASVDADVWKAK